MNVKSISVACAMVAVATGTAARADVTGSVDATITLTSGCIINEQLTNNGASNSDFGTIDFGSRNSLFTSADGEAVGSGTGIAIQCTPGITPSLTFGAGQNDGQGTGSGNRAMAHATESGQYVKYGLYSDAGRNTLIAIDGSLALASDGSAQVIRVYGRAYGAAGLVAGNYSDMVLVTLEL
ncbi:Csu type fimbrial protein [Sphingomonas colocasiae]|uniref:Spore coat U domain-containing protein n=1 Tax=Sphingomonas colocasiae TaxID=1848973 RepID=A0ABS7PLE5_9SPHN|nr:spore coat U domain-containing protein [Sphingomonas colocasiae]MBY8821794.1 spore coat U domain-containing protein [Sphingomonas colocasiae]